VDGKIIAVKPAGRSRFTGTLKGFGGNREREWLILNRMENEFSRTGLFACGGPRWPTVRQRGFTAVELVVVAILMALAFTVFYKFFGNRANTEAQLTNRLSLQVEARKAADMVIAQLREASEVVKPTLGQSSSFVVFLDAINRTCLLYPTRDQENSARYKKDLFKLVSFTHEYPGSGAATKEKFIARSLRRVAFTVLAPNSVQINVIVANEKEEYEFLTEAGLMNFGANQ
jgi:prepilin-type N-terminal cleavage/methylation domain-containing protein